MSSTKKPRIAVVLSGCGVFDGAEIHESVLTLLALDRAGCLVTCFAPDVPQLHVVDHGTGDVVPGTARNVRTESARIARGAVADVADARIEDFDAVVLPGGFGAAKNLCTFAVDGSACTVEAGTAALLGAALDARTPIAVACIAPAVLAAVLRDRGESAELTIGTDDETGAALEAMGVVHVPCSVERAVVDEERRVISTPAYMLAASIGEAAASIDAMVASLMQMLGQPAGGR
ncbi:Enhancing lycopene biosynthesis protein 2 [Planctomycetes bacterium Pla163]|uniref:Enhancing lycopene biosynthesis protein 2 n=1 Tax=Rohdeia mirabilis TaxID=2528008 RepID=A0A518CYU1_9BACT|nr:Enhancing lycopene biosynthesis protein 2 [Planctomycetes bacterium Pla163]